MGGFPGDFGLLLDFPDAKGEVTEGSYFTLDALPSLLVVISPRSRMMFEPSTENEETCAVLFFFSLPVASEQHGTMHTARSGYMYMASTAQFRRFSNSPCDIFGRVGALLRTGESTRAS